MEEGELKTDLKIPKEERREKREIVAEIKKEIAVIEVEKSIARKSEAAVEKIEEVLGEKLEEAKKKELRTYVEEETRKAYLEPSEEILSNNGENYLREVKKIVPEQLFEKADKGSLKMVAKEIETGIVLDQENRTEMVELARMADLERRIDEAGVGEKMSFEERWVMKQAVLENIYPERVSEIAAYQHQSFARAEQLNTHPTAGNWTETKIISNVVNGRDKVKNIIAKYTKAKDFLNRIEDKVPEVRALNKVIGALENSPHLQKVYEGIRQTLKITEVGNTVTGKVTTGLGKLLGSEGLKEAGIKIATRIGGQAVGEFATQSLAVIAESGGMQQGLLTIAKGILSGGVKAAAATGEAAASGAAAGASAAGSGALASAVAAFQAIPVAGQIALIAVALVVVTVSAFKKIKKGFDKLKENLTKIGLDLPDFRKDLGNFAGSIANFGFAAGVGLASLLLALPGVLVGMGSMVAAVVVPLFVGLFFYSTFFQNTQVSTFVPPVGIGGGCVRKDELLVSGEINCNQNLSMQVIPEVDRETYFRLASQWTSGKNYAKECFDAVVCESRSAGVNPAWSLYAWLHESGASNYDYKPGETEDFGIHNSTVAKENFQEQIEAFLKLEPGINCPGGDYWLNLATNYLTGGCDPDEANPITGQTGRDYLKAIEETWAWIAPGVPLPSTIRISPTGEDCGGGEATSPEQKGYEFTDENGEVWVCEEDPSKAGNYDNIEFPEWDPNTPLPEGCPDRLPSNGGSFTQGPFAVGCSHRAMSIPAIDIGLGGGNAIIATHDGVVEQGYNGIYGFYVDLHGRCEGKEFVTRYAHMPEGGFKTNDRAVVSKGTVIGIVDTTGSSTGNHIHYDIKGLSTDRFGQYLGLSVDDTKKLWGCCNGENGIYCPTLK